MKSIDRPSRIFLFVTLPQTLLAALLIALAARTAHTGALWILAASVAFNAAFTGYAIVCRKRESAHREALIALAVSACAMLAASALLLEGAALLGGALGLRLAAMLLCAVSVLYAAMALSKTPEPRADMSRYVMGFVALPFVWFLAFNIVTGVRLETVSMILIVAGAFAAAFLLGRIVLARGSGALLTEKSRKRRWFALYSIFSVVLPLIGLLVNLQTSNMFGDFSDPAFFIVPVINGVVLLIPPFADKRLRLLRFGLLSAALVYFVYFFVIFVPYMPIGFLGLIVIVGGLVFAPTGALLMQMFEIVREWRQLKTLWSGARVLAVFLPALLLIPACMLTSYIGDRQNLQNAASYLETSAAPSGEPVDLGRLKRTLNSSGGTFEISRDIFAEFSTTNNTPLLSAIYSALVLDNKVMRDGDIDRMRQLFFDEYDEPWDASVSDGLTVNGENITDVRLTDIRTETTYDAEAGTNRTWVHLTLQNTSSGWNEEYVTLFPLPEGAYISDYYLDVGANRKYGILADERAAMSVYEDIVRVNQDPGVLHYADDGQLELRVFPFDEGETRHTGFEIIHTQPFILTLDGRTVDVTAANTSDEIKFNGGTLVSAAMKQTLPAAETRGETYWFVVDSSAHSNIGYQLSLIEDYASMGGISDAMVMFVSYDITQATLEDARSLQVPPHSGFNLALAVKTALTENGSGTVPVILFTSGNPAGALMPEHSSWLAKQYPENPYFYRLRDDLKLVPYNFDGSIAGGPLDEPAVFPLRLYGDTVVRDDGQSEIIPSGGAAFALTGSQYTDALTLDAAIRSNPAMDKATSLKLLRAAFRSHVLTPQTSFIVVETAQQEADLWEAQAKLLEQDSAAAARETLDEPPLIICLLAGIAVFTVIPAVRRYRKKAMQK